MRPAPPAFGQDPAPAEWIRPRLTGAWGAVTGPGTTPDGYDAYARLLHPVELDGGLHRWADVAAHTGRQVHPLVQWHRLVGSDDEDGYVNADWPGEPPDAGNLHPEHLDALSDVLAGHTTTPDDCWFAVWAGWGADETAVWLRGAGPRRPAHDEVWWRRLVSGDVRRRRQPPDGPVQLPGRDYHLGRGPLRSACAIGELHAAESHTAESHPAEGGWWFIPQSPNLCWPEDRDSLRLERRSYRGAPTVADPRLLDAAPATHPRAKVPSSRTAPPIQPGL